MNKNEDLIILLGGLGSRLRSLVNDVPKPMALINNKPFLEYLLEYWNNLGIKRFHLLTGYKSEIIENYFGNSFREKELIYYNETKSLGTGGAIKNFLNKVSSEFDEKNFIMLNGDTWLEINYEEFLSKIKKYKNKIVIAIKNVKYNNRYASIRVQDDMITQITPPNYKQADINAGLYAIKFKKLNKYLNRIEQTKFSFEELILPALIQENELVASNCITRFIDIGVPEDYLRATNYIQKKFNQSKK